MANNCVVTQTFDIPAGENLLCFTLGAQNFKNIKWIVTIKEETTNRVHAYEVSATYTLSPIAPTFTKYALIGDDIDHEFVMTYNNTSMLFEMSVVNNEAQAIKVYFGEIERIE